MSLLTAKPKFLATEDEMKTLLCVACLLPARDAFRCSGQRGDLYCRGCLDRWNSADRVEPDDWCCSYDYDSEQEKSPRGESSDSVNDTKHGGASKEPTAVQGEASGMEKEDRGEEEMADNDKDRDAAVGSLGKPFESGEKEHQAKVGSSDGDETKYCNVKTGSESNRTDEVGDKEDEASKCDNVNDPESEDTEGEITDQEDAIIPIGDSRALWKALETMHDKATYIRGYSERIVDLRMENMSMIYHEPNSEPLSGRMKNIKKMADKIIDEANILQQLVEKAREAVEWNRSSAKALVDWMYKAMLQSDPSDKKFSFTAAATKPQQQFGGEHTIVSPVPAGLVSENDAGPVTPFNRKRVEEQFARIDNEADTMYRFFDLLKAAGERVVTEGNCVHPITNKALEEIRQLAEHPSPLRVRMDFLRELPAQCQETLERLVGKIEEVDGGIVLLTRKYAPEVYVPLRSIRKTAKWIHSALVIVQEAMCRMSRPDKLPGLVPDQRVVHVGAAGRGCMVCRKVGDYKESPGANFGVGNLPVECTFTGDDGMGCNWNGRYADFASHTHLLVIPKTAAGATSATASCSVCGRGVAGMSKAKQFYQENICSIQ